MEQISTVRGLVSLWPGRSEFAADCGVPLERVHGWVRANSIPARYHAEVLRAACARQLSVSAFDLVRIHDKASASEGEAA